MESTSNICVNNGTFSRNVTKFTTKQPLILHSCSPFYTFVTLIVLFWDPKIIFAGIATIQM